MTYKVRIDLCGDGGEVCVGETTVEAYEFWKDDSGSEIWGAVSYYDEDEDDGSGIGWRMGESEISEYGCASDGRLEVDIDGETITYDIEDSGLEIRWKYHRERDLKRRTPYCHVYTVEKGCFGSLELELEEPFDIVKVGLSGVFIQMPGGNHKLITDISYEGSDAGYESGGDTKPNAEEGHVFTTNG